MYERCVKRAFDLTVGVLAFIVLIPFLVLISLISACAHGGSNVFFIQQRVGYKGRRFNIIKFKTMNDKRDGNGLLLPDSERQTAWGQIMRKCSLDELLQLINVVKGDMSIVGPRPLIPEQVADLTPREQLRFEVRPGITGLAQVCGRNDISFTHKFKYDAWYVRHLSFALDVRILVDTVRVVILGDGVEYNPAVDNRMKYETSLGSGIKNNNDYKQVV